MKNKLLFALSLYSPFLQANLIQWHCWDGTYRYNAASIVETEKNFEVGVKGYHLGTHHFEFTSGNHVHIDPPNQSRIFIPFKKEECVKSESEIKCQKDMVPNLKLANFFIDQRILNYNEYVSAMTPVGVAKIQLTYIYNRNIKLEFHGEEEIWGPVFDVKTIEFKDSLKCSFVPDNLNSILFPEELKIYLEKNPNFISRKEF